MFLQGQMYRDFYFLSNLWLRGQENIACYTELPKGEVDMEVYRWSYMEDE